MIEPYEGCTHCHGKNETACQYCETNRQYHRRMASASAAAEAVAKHLPTIASSLLRLVEILDKATEEQR